MKLDGQRVLRFIKLFEFPVTNVTVYNFSFFRTEAFLF